MGRPPNKHRPGRTECGGITSLFGTTGSQTEREIGKNGAIGAV